LAARHKKIYSLFGFRWFRRRGHASSNIWGGTALQIIACGMVTRGLVDVVPQPKHVVNNMFLVWGTTRKIYSLFVEGR
jgi:hypothetical protein